MILVPKGKSRSECRHGVDSCHQSLSASGMFVFDDVACGSYTLYIDGSLSSITYAMSTDSIDIDVGYDDVLIRTGCPR